MELLVATLAVVGVPLTLFRGSSHKELDIPVLLAVPHPKADLEKKCTLNPINYPTDVAQYECDSNDKARLVRRVPYWVDPRSQR